jgi:hypothetical protein
MMFSMRALPATRFFGVAALCAAASIGMTQAQATNVNEINFHRNWWDLSLTVKSDDGVVHAFTVPQGRHLILTDVIMTHNVSSTTGTFRANIGRGPASNPSPCDTYDTVLPPYVSPAETVSINMTTGIEFLPGEQLCILIGSAGAGEGVTFAFTGYLAPPVTGP